MAKNVLNGLVTAWRLAGRPTSFSSSAVKATIEGVVFMPSAFSRTLGLPPSMTATHEFVVPRSMPITLAMCLSSSFCGRPSGPEVSASRKSGGAAGRAEAVPYGASKR